MNDPFAWSLDLLGRSAVEPDSAAASPETSKKRRHTRTQAISGVDRLRLLLWILEVKSRSKAVLGRDIGLTELPDVFAFDDIPVWNLNLLDRLEALPGSTVDEVELGSVVGKPENLPFTGTRELYETGPDGLPLWEVLRGNSDVCFQLIDEEVENSTGENPEANYYSFEQRAKVLLRNRLPASHDSDRFWEIIRKNQDEDFFVDFNIIALASPSLDEVRVTKEFIIDGPMWTRPDEVVFFSGEKVVATIALFVMSLKKGERVPECYYMLVGVLKNAIKAELPYGEEIAKYMEEVIGVPKFLKT